MMDVDSELLNQTKGNSTEKISTKLVLSVEGFMDTAQLSEPKVVIETRGIHVEVRYPTEFFVHLKSDGLLPNFTC